MADIELVIKISEEEYEYCKTWELMSPIAKAIVKGTPLQKGHGDLIDRRELIKSGVIKGFCDWYDEIKYADAIIEADDKNEEKSATSYDSNEEDREV